MDELLVTLRDIISSEYAQWMRYTYLSSLGFGLHTGPLKCQFEEHAMDELDHAKRVTHWLIDLGGMPPTEVPCVEQYAGSTEGAIEWILEAELVGIRKYNYASELAVCLNMPGLASEIGTILEKEHEHSREMFNLIAPHMLSEDQVTMVVVAHSFHKFSIHGGEIFNRLVRRAVDHTQTTWQELEGEQQPQQFQQYLSEAIDNAIQHVTQQYPDTKELLKVLPDETHNFLVKGVEQQVRELWSQRDRPDARSGILFFKDLYEWHYRLVRRAVDHTQTT